MSAHADSAITSPAVADDLMYPWLESVRPAGMPLFDCHTHMGSDLDGSRATAAEVRRAVELIDAHALVFPLAQAGGYREANSRVIDAAAASEGRLVPLCRVDPPRAGVTEAERALARGAAGIKLHPRAERFRLADETLRPVFALAAERRVPVIVHAGRGIPSLGRDALEVAARYPEMPLVLAHAAITDLAWIWRPAASLPNLFFDTAWWNTADLIALFSLVPPGQILFGSDLPYGRPVAAAAVMLRAAQAAGLSEPQLASVAGGQLERLLAGEPPEHAGRAPMSAAPPAGPLLERIHTLLVAAAARLTTGGPADEYLELARLACKLPEDHPDALVAASVVELLDRREYYLAGGPAQHGPRPPGIHMIFVAAAVARTPTLPLASFEPVIEGAIA